MAEADHDFLALHPRADIRFCLIGRGVARDDLHRDFIGATVLRSAQRADGAGDARMHVAAGAGDHPCGERRCVELMLGVQHQRLVERLGVQRARWFAMQQVQEVRRDRIVVGLAIDPPPVAGEVPPVQQHRAEARHQPVGDVARFRRGVAVALGQHRAEHRTTRAQHVHRMRVGRHQFQGLGNDHRQPAQALELGPVHRQLRCRRQRAVHQQVRDFLERGLRREVLDVVAAVMQVVATAADRAQRGVAGGGSAQRHRFLGLGRRTGWCRSCLILLDLACRLGWRAGIPALSEPASPPGLRHLPANNSSSLSS